MDQRVSVVLFRREVVKLETAGLGGNVDGMSHVCTQSHLFENVPRNTPTFRHIRALMDTMSNIDPLSDPEERRVLYSTLDSFR